MNETPNSNSTPPERNADGGATHPPTPQGAAQLRRVALGSVWLDIMHPADPAAVMAAVDPEEFARDERIPYWSDIWPASVALGRHLLSLDLAGVRVIELGAGVGLAGLAAARAGADVLVTDYEAEALRFARENAGRNNLRIRTRCLDWRAQEWPGGFDLAIAADVLYEARSVAPLAALIPRLLGSGGRAIVADAGRPYAGAFIAALAEQGLVTNVRHVPIFWDGRTRTIELIEARPS